MAETEHAAVADTESFSKEYVDRLKADLAAKSEEASVLRAYKSGHEQKTREIIASLQPDVNSFVDTVMGEHKDHAADMASMKEWATSCHQSASVDTALPLARLMSCASATIKRTREEASVASQNSETLGATMKELEAVKSVFIALRHLQASSRSTEVESALKGRVRVAVRLAVPNERADRAWGRECGGVHRSFWGVCTRIVRPGRQHAATQQQLGCAPALHPPTLDPWPHALREKRAR